MYVKPEIKLESVQEENLICVSFNNVESNSGVEYGGGGSGPARSRGNSIWDDSQDNGE